MDLLSLNVRQEAHEPIVPMKTAEAGSPPPASDRIIELESRISYLEQQIASLSHEKCKDTYEKG